MIEKYPKGIEVFVGAICVNDAGHVLVLENAKWNKPTLGGGRIRPGEKIQNAVFRKVFEDTGIRATKCEFLTYGEHFFTPPLYPRDMHEICLDFAVMVGNAMPQPDGKEILSARWLPISEARKICVDTWAPALDLIETKLKS